MEEKLRIFEQKVHSTYYDLDKSNLRGMQQKMYNCAASCCDNKTDSFNQVQTCIDRCTAPYQKAQQYVKNEFEDFQRRVERCILVCSDQTRNEMEKNKLTELNDQVKADYEKCAVSCLTKHMDLLPSVVFKMQESLKQHGS